VRVCDYNFQDPVRIKFNYKLHARIYEPSQRIRFAAEKSFRPFNKTRLCNRRCSPRIRISVGYRRAKCAKLCAETVFYTRISFVSTRKHTENPGDLVKQPRDLKLNFFQARHYRLLHYHRTLRYVALRRISESIRGNFTKQTTSSKGRQI